MKTRFLLVLAMAICFVSIATAQTKASGTLQCSKSDPMHMIEIGDRPGHSMMTSHSVCTWSKGMDVGGMAAKDGASTDIGEVTGNKSNSSGVHWGTVEGGDKYFVRFSGSATSTKEGNLEAASGTWKYTGGTGKLKGITGKGTYKGKGNADGSTTWEVEGDYTLAAAKAPAAKAPAKK
jgi:hypothetical protein